MIIFRYPPLQHLRLHKLGYAISRNPEMRERFKREPQKVMDEFGLTQEEKQLILSRDGVKMYDIGIQPYIIFALVWQAFGEWPSREQIKKLGYGRTLPDKPPANKVE
ncbi:MAG: hypothetical protein NZ921_01495 [Candidatus Caldarchaeum sp.]|nr:hypothetical protein [Candidatus Caldarchaeum sp.]